MGPANPQVVLIRLDRVWPGERVGRGFTVAPKLKDFDVLDVVDPVHQETSRQYVSSLTGTRFERVLLPLRNEQIAIFLHVDLNVDGGPPEGMELKSFVDLVVFQ